MALDRNASAQRAGKPSPLEGEGKEGGKTASNLCDLCGEALRCR